VFWKIFAIWTYLTFVAAFFVAFDLPHSSGPSYDQRRTRRDAS
jgi:hypothetical protein